MMQTVLLVQKIQKVFFSTALKVATVNLHGELNSKTRVVPEMVPEVDPEVDPARQEIVRNKHPMYLANLELLVLRMVR